MRVDFPDPVLPHIPICSPALAEKVTPLRTNGSFSLYLISRSLNSITPYSGHFSEILIGISFAPSSPLAIIYSSYITVVNFRHLSKLINYVSIFPIEYRMQQKVRSMVTPEVKTRAIVPVSNLSLRNRNKISIGVTIKLPINVNLCIW